MMGVNAGLYRPGVIMWLMVFLIAHSTHSAPVYDGDTTQVAEYEGAAPGCYYNFQYYEEGDRIMTNEPCLNCTCHNRMLMCYLRVCPQFTKAIGQNCQVEKRPDQCCPVITCPEVPVHLLTSTTSAPSSSSDSTEVGFHDNYGCSIDNKFYADGAQLPTDPNNPCELCYCIRNRTTCTIQQCTLKIARCSPVLHPGICCPVKYDCDYDEELTTTPGTTPGLIMTTTMAPGIESPKCTYQGKLFDDGALLYSTAPCHHCYCFHGDIACAVQECGKPMETHGKNCTAETPPDGECCPTTYKCEDESESIEGEKHEQVTHDENEIVATQAPLPTQKVNEEEQKHEEIYPGADNAIPEVHQVQEEVTLDTAEVEATTRGVLTESVPPKTTITPETDQLTEEHTTPAQVSDDNAVPQEPVEAVIHVDEMTQHAEEFTPTESAVYTESVGHEKLTTIVEDVQATKSPAEDKLESEEPVNITESHTEPSEKLPTGPPARSEDQPPVEPQIVQTAEISTHLPRSENESTETPAVTESTTNETEEKPEEQKPIPAIPESNEIPKGGEVPTGETTTKPEEAMTPGEMGGTEETRPEEISTEPSISGTSEKPEQLRPEIELPQTESSEKSDEETTDRSAETPDISNRVPEQEPTSVTEEEKKPEQTITTTPSAEFTNVTHEEPATGTTESDLNLVPTQGPTGIDVPTRGPVTKAEDNESVPEIQVTESYEEIPETSEMQTPENLMTDKPEMPIELWNRTEGTSDDNIAEQPQTPVQQESTPSITESPITKPEDQTSAEHIQHIPQTSETNDATEVPSDGEQSTVPPQFEGTSVSPSTGITEVEMPMKGIQVSGEQSSEEGTSSEVPTIEEKQPDSSESSSEEESEESSSPLIPLAHPSSTESSSQTESGVIADVEVTPIVESEHKTPAENEPKGTSTQASPTEKEPSEEILTEPSINVEPVNRNPTEDKPTEEQATEKTTEILPAEEKPTGDDLTEKSPVDQSEKETPMRISTEPPSEEHPTEVQSVEPEPTEKPIEEHTVESESGTQSSNMSTEIPVEEQPAKEGPSGESVEMMLIDEDAGEEKPTEKPTEKSIPEQHIDSKPTEKQPAEVKPTDMQFTTEIPAEEPQTEMQPTREQPVEKVSTEGQLTITPATDEQVAEEKPTEVATGEQQVTENPTTTPTEEQLIEEKTTVKPVTEQSEEAPTEIQPTEEKTTEEPSEAQSPVVTPTEERVTEGGPTNNELPQEKPIDALPEGEKLPEKKPTESSTEQEETESTGEEQTTEEQPHQTEGQTELSPEEPVTVGVKVEAPALSSTESSSTSQPVEMEQTSGTEVVGGVTEQSETSNPQESSTQVVEVSTPSETGESQSTEPSVVNESITEKEASEQPVVEVQQEVEQEESVKPTKESTPVPEQTESSMVEQVSSETKDTGEGEEQDTERPIFEEGMTPTVQPIAGEKQTEKIPAESSEPPKIELEQGEQTISSVEIESQTAEAIAVPTVTEEATVQKGAEEENVLQQTSTPSISSEKPPVTAVTKEESTEHPALTDTTVSEEKPDEESGMQSTETSTPEEGPTIPSMIETTFPENNELPGHTQTEFKPEEQSTAEVAETTSPSSQHEEPTKSVIHEEEQSSKTTEKPITGETTSDNTSEAEMTPASVSEQQPHEEPVETTEISSEIPVTESSDVQSSHTEEEPVESTKGHTIAPTPAQEQTSVFSAESVTEPVVSIENEESIQKYETPIVPNELPTEPATVTEELAVSSEQPYETPVTSSSTESDVASEGTTVIVDKSSEGPVETQDKKPTRDELPSTVTSMLSSTIEKDVTPSILAETAAPIEGEQIVTDVPHTEPTKLTSKSPIDEDTPEVTSTVFIPTDQSSEFSPESTIQPLQSTEQSIDMESSSTTEPEETLPMTSGEFKPPGIPGEGNCLIDGESFTNNSEIPPANPCQISCHCVSSIVQCELVQCPPPPSHLSNCMPIHIGSDACCPMFSCDALPTTVLEADNQMAGHPVPEKQGQEQETKESMAPTTPVDESPGEVTKQPEAHTIAPTITEESTSTASTGSLSTIKPETTIAEEQTANIAPEMTSETAEKTETPTVVSEEITTKVEISPTLPSALSTETAGVSESAEGQTIVTIDNQVGELDSTTSVPEKEKPIETESTSVPQVTESEGGVETTESTMQHSIATEEAKTESGMISMEGIKEPTMFPNVHETVDSIASVPSKTEPSTEKSVVSPIAGQEPVEGSEATTIAAEGPITLSEPENQSSEKPEEESSSSHTPNKLIPSSSTEESTEPVLAEHTGAPQPESEMTEPTNELPPPVTEQTAAPIVPEQETIAPSVEEPEKVSTGEPPAVSDTDTPSTTTEEHKHEESTVIPQKEIPERTEIIPEHAAESDIPEKHSGSEEQSTVSINSDGSTQSLTTPEEPVKTTEAPESTESPKNATITEGTMTSIEPSLSSESSLQPSTEQSVLSSIAPGITEHGAPDVAETGEPTATSISTESNDIPSSESERPTSVPSIENEPEIGSSEMPSLETSKPEGDLETTSLPSTTKTEQDSEAPIQTSSSAAATTEVTITESQSVEVGTEKPVDVTSAASVETDFSTETSETEKPVESVEGIKSVTKSPELVAPTEVITTEKTSEAPLATGAPAESQPLPTEETESQHSNIPAATEEPQPETKFPLEEVQPTPVSPDSTSVIETSSEQPSLPSEETAEATTEVSGNENPTEFVGETTELNVPPSAPAESSEIVPVHEVTPSEAPFDEKNEVPTGIKTEITVKPTAEETTIHGPEEDEIHSTTPQDYTPSTTSSVVIESSTYSEDTSPTTDTTVDEKPTEIIDQQPIKPEEIPVTQSEVTETTALPSFDGSSPRAPIEPSSEPTQTASTLVNSEEIPVTESNLAEEPHQIVPETHPVQPVDQGTSTPSSSEPPEHIEDNQVPESPIISQQHTINEGQQTISPITPEVVQEHVTESDANITSPHHTYIPPSSTESPSGGEYPEQSVSGEDNPHFPVHGGTHLNGDDDYDEDDQAVYGPGTCRYGGKVYVSAQQIPRDDPCDFCFCFRSDIICLQQSCPPPIPGCHEEPIGGFCCPRYECPVSMATSLNITTTTTTTTTTLPPHFLSHAYKGATRRSGCQIRGQAFKVGEVIQSASGPCLHCTCGGDGNMKCEPRVCTPEPMIRQMIAAATAKRRR